MPGKNKATSYSDFYKGTSKTVPGRDPMIKHETEKESDDDTPNKMLERRRAAIKRRLQRKAGR